MRNVACVLLLSMSVAGCSEYGDKTVGERPVASTDAHALPRFEEVAYAAEERLGRCAPDCRAPAPYLGITRVICRIVAPGLSQCGFVAFRRRLNLTGEDHGEDGRVGNAARCIVTMRSGQGAHDIYWTDEVTDPTRPRATSTLRCAPQASAA